jgi:DNA (cytosine-5)-methyltransferase 1
MEACSQASLHEALSARAQLTHGGVPCGALLVGKRHINRCQKLLQQHGQLRLLAVDYVLPDTFLLHLPSQAAAALDPDLNPEPQLAAALDEYLQETAGVWYSGVRLLDPALSHCKRGPYPPFNAAAAAAAGTPVPPPPDVTQGFTFAELFAGIGGFRLGLEALGGRCTFASEIDKAARSTYRSYWPPAAAAAATTAAAAAASSSCFEADSLFGDITTLYAEQLPRFDILTAGFPCQPFSDRNTSKP